jgi:hypothetical protein
VRGNFEELSLSLGVEKSYVAQVFDLYQPRSLDTLEVCVIGELADELGMDAHALARELKENGAEAGCKPARADTRRLYCLMPRALLAAQPAAAMRTRLAALTPCKRRAAVRAVQQRR